MLLADIGNTFAHLFIDGQIIDLDIETLIDRYSDKNIYYINVNPKNINRLEAISNWIDLKDYIYLENSYSGMGIDRQVLLLSRGDGIYIDAGSAITIDKKENGKFVGGTILPGIKATIDSFSKISSVLRIDKLESIDINRLPSSSTKESISYGVVAPIVALVEKINSSNLPIYCCGGDGEIIAKYLNGAIYKKDLIFEGMKEILRRRDVKSCLT